MKTFNVFKDAIEYSKQNPSKLTEYKWFNKNGSLSDHCFFLNGKQHGEYKTFYSDGTLHFHAFYLNGDLHGEYKWFKHDGSINAHYFLLNNIEQPQLDYLKTERDETTLTLLFGENYI